jgi:hypothetical protein
MIRYIFHVHIWTTYQKINREFYVSCEDYDKTLKEFEDYVKTLPGRNIFTMNNFVCIDVVAFSFTVSKQKTDNWSRYK